MAGWAELKATGYDSASYRSTYRGLSQEQTLSTFQSDVQSLFPHATVADVEPLKELPLPAPGSISTADADLPPFPSGPTWSSPAS